MNSKKYFDDGINDRLPRRNMIAALFGGGVALALPGNFNASTPRADEACVMPSPADGLSYYLAALGAGTISYDILRPYFAVIGKTSGDLSKMYAALKTRLLDLQTLVPELRTNKEFCRLREATDAGKTSTSYLKKLGDGAVTMAAAQSVMISYVSSSLNDSASGLKDHKDGLVLSEAAVKKLREIICDIEALIMPTQTLDAASTALTNADNELKKSTALVVAKLKQAISVLVSGEIKKIPIDEARRKAIELIDAVLVDSKTFDSYEIAPELKKRLDEYRTEQKQRPDSSMPTDLSRIDPMAGPHTVTAVEHLREFLRGVKVWIGRDDWVSIHPADSGEVRFVNASHRESGPMFLGIIRQIQAILHNHLHDGTTGRASYCYARIRIIFFGNSDQAIRKRKIEDLLQYLPSRGDRDGDAGRRAAAAAELLTLPFE